MALKSANVSKEKKVDIETKIDHIEKEIGEETSEKFKIEVEDTVKKLC